MTDSPLVTKPMLHAALRALDTHKSSYRLEKTSDTQGTHPHPRARYVFVCPECDISFGGDWPAAHVHETEAALVAALRLQGEVE